MCTMISRKIDTIDKEWELQCAQQLQLEKSACKKSMHHKEFACQRECMCWWAWSKKIENNVSFNECECVESVCFDK